MPINSEHLASLTDADVIDQNGDKVGGVGQIYLDDASGQPAWASVKSGLFGLRESFVPLNTAEVVDGNVSVPYTKDFIKDAPRVDADNHLDDSQQTTLYSYYGLDRPAAPAGGSGSPDQTATFSSEQTADDLYDGRSEGEPVPTADGGRDGAPPVDDTARGGAESQAAAIGAAGAAGVAGAGLAANDGTGGPAAEEAAVGDYGTDADHVGDDARVTDAAAADAAATDSLPADSREVDATSEAPPATYQQENPAAQADWSAEQSPEEPVSTSWSVPTTDPADEEQTKVDRSGYAADRPAAHSSAYEGHAGAAGGAAPEGEALAGEDRAAASGDPVIDETTDEGAAYATDADTAFAADTAASSADVDSMQFGTVEPVGAESIDGDTDGDSDDAVTGAADQTGTGYPAESPEATGLGAGGAVAGGAVLGGAVAGGLAASDTETTAYETPGAVAGDESTGGGSGTEFTADREDPFHGGTQPTEDATLAAGTDGGDASGEPGGAAADPGGDAEVFGATGYRPDRDGAEMTDEERERLNEARGAL